MRKDEIGDPANLKTDRQMNEQANASAKPKEVQRHLQADIQLHRICFCTTYHTKWIYSFIF